MRLGHRRERVPFASSDGRHLLPRTYVWAAVAAIGSAKGVHIAAGRSLRRTVARGRTNAALPATAGTDSEIAWQVSTATVVAANGP